MSSFIPDTLDFLNYFNETAFDLETLPPIEVEDQVSVNDTFISAPDERDLLNCCSPQLLTGQTLAGNTAAAAAAQEEILLEFVLYESGGEVVSASDHAYTVQVQQTPTTEDQNPAPPANAGRAPSPLTGQWTGLHEAKVDLPSGPPPMLSLQLMGTPEHYKYSEHNSLHHIKSQGKVSVTALLKGLPFSEPENQFGLLMYLRRTHPDYSHVPIDTVCPAHQNGIYLNPIHPLTDAHKFMTVSTGECGAAQLFDIGSLPGPESEVTLNLSFPCEDSCVRASTRKDVRKEKAIEKARDSELVAKLVMLNRDSSIKSVLAEMSIPVWIKSTINDRDLEKPQRRKPKGAAAQMAAKRKAEEQQDQAREEVERKKSKPNTKIKLEEIDNATFKEMVIQKIDNNEYSNELKHFILAL